MFSKLSPVSTAGDYVGKVLSDNINEYDKTFDDASFGVGSKISRGKPRLHELIDA